MRVCICTVIKNEHQYLDEWIKYHLSLGIDHIYVYEDIDSDSHKDITDKYDKVSLNSVISILSDSQKRDIEILKHQNEINPQDTYFISILTILKNEHKFDWCFVIDVDEFITCSDDLKEVVSTYQDYEAFILSWENYGACNYINKPNYTEKCGVVKKYAKKSDGFVDNSPVFHTKTCYKLETFNSTYYWNIHQPSDSCNWCRTDFSKDRKKEIFDNIYIRHYITKSWEEYIEKKYKRGYFIGRSRTDDFFFYLNPELRCRKTELMEALKDETLVILPYKQRDEGRQTELELALSFWKINCTFNYHFVVIGEYDNSIKDKFPWVEFIECKTRAGIIGQYNPHLDMHHKMKLVYNKYKEKYSGFIWMVDDNYAIKPFTIFDILQTHYHTLSFIGQIDAPENYWRHDKGKTRQLLDREGLPHVNYTTHFPCWFDGEKLNNIINKFNLENESYVLEDLYFNYYKHEEPILDTTIRLGIWDTNMCKKEFQEAVENPNIKFMCSCVESWGIELEEKLKNLLYEQQNR